MDVSPPASSLPKVGRLGIPSFTRLGRQSQPPLSIRRFSQMKCVSKGVDSIGVAWSAKKSSRFSRDTHELQIRGCVGPLEKALATEWVDIDDKFALEGT